VKKKHLSTWGPVGERGRGKKKQPSAGPGEHREKDTWTGPWVGLEWKGHSKRLKKRGNGGDVPVANGNATLIKTRFRTKNHTPKSAVTPRNHTPEGNQEKGGDFQPRGGAKKAREVNIP